MFTLPIITFFVVQYLCQDKPNPDNWAGGAAILVTNIIVGAYCYTAYVEDLDEDQKGVYSDSGAPRVGIFKAKQKERIDWSNHSKRKTLKWL